MRKVGSIFLAVLFLAGLSIASGFPRLVADDLLNASETRWLEMLREQIPQVSESEQRMAISMTVGILAEVGRYTEAKTIALQQVDGDAQSSLLVTIAASMARKSLFEDAFSTVSEISDPGWKDILVSVALVLVAKLYDSVGKDWSGLSTAFGAPILISLLVRLERFDAIDQILERKRESFESDPTESWYLPNLESVAESLVEQNHIAKFESRLERAQTPDEKLYLLMGAIIGADYARRTKQ